MPIPLGILAVAGAGAAGGGSYELIESSILSSTTATITFTSIPATYKHLQLRMTVRSGNNGSERVLVRFNSDTGANYANHSLYGNGSSVFSESATSNTGFLNYIMPNSNQTTGIFGAGIYDILDYANTSKNTTVRILGGAAGAGVLYPIGLHSFLWNNTAAVSTITITSDNSPGFVSGSRFSLYGIKG